MISDEFLKNQVHQLIKEQERINIFKLKNGEEIISNGPYSFEDGEFPCYRCKTDEEIIYINAKEVMYIKLID